MAEITEDPTLKRARSEEANAPQLAGYELVGYKPDPVMVWIYKNKNDNVYHKYDAAGALVKVEGRGGYRWNLLQNGTPMSGQKKYVQKTSIKRSASAPLASPGPSPKKVCSDTTQTKEQELFDFLANNDVTNVNNWVPESKTALAKNFFAAYETKSESQARVEGKDREIATLIAQKAEAERRENTAKREQNRLLAERRSDDPEILLRRVFDGTEWLGKLAANVFHKLEGKMLGGDDFAPTGSTVEDKVCDVIKNQLNESSNPGIIYNKQSAEGEGRPDFVFQNCNFQDLQWPYDPNAGRLFVEVKWLKSKKGDGSVKMPKAERDRLFGQVVGYFKDHAEDEDGPFFAGLILIVVDTHANSNFIKNLYETLRPYTLLMQAAARASSPKNMNVNVSLSVATIGPEDGSRSKVSGRDRGQGFYFSPKGSGTYF